MQNVFLKKDTENFPVWKIMITIADSVNIMAADGLVTQGAKASAGTALT